MNIDTLLASASPEVRRRNSHLKGPPPAVLAARFDAARTEVAEAKDEKTLQGQIEGLLRRNGMFPIRQRTDKKSTIAEGAPDILFSDLLDRGTGWEIKMPGKKPTPEQLAVHEQMRAAHWRIVSCVDSYQQALELVEALKAEAAARP